MKLPSDESPNMNGEGYVSDEYDQLEMVPPPIRDGDFSEYMWMENEEEFNSQVLRQLEEEELMEQCIVAMLDDEYQQENSNPRDNATNEANVSSRNNGSGSNPNSRSSTTADNSNSSNGLSESMNNLSLSSNGVRAANSNNSADTTNVPRQFSAQDRLRRFRPPSTNPSQSSESEQKSTLNPDAKEFVPLVRDSSETTTPKTS